VTHTLRITNEKERAKAIRWAERVPMDWYVEFKPPTRSIEQNARMWELLGRVSLKMDLGGRKFAPDQWKAIFMKAIGDEVEFLPSLDGSFFPHGFRSSKLSVRQMADLQTFIEAYCAEKGVDIWGGQG